MGFESLIKVTWVRTPVTLFNDKNIVLQFNSSTVSSVGVYWLRTTQEGSWWLCTILWGTQQFCTLSTTTMEGTIEPHCRLITNTYIFQLNAPLLPKYKHYHFLVVHIIHTTIFTTLRYI